MTGASTTQYNTAQKPTERRWFGKEGKVNQTQALCFWKTKGNQSRQIIVIGLGTRFYYLSTSVPVTRRVVSNKNRKSYTYIGNRGQVNCISSDDHCY